jgi:hypothetical protein
MSWTTRRTTESDDGLGGLAKWNDAGNGSGYENGGRPDGGRLCDDGRIPSGT